MSSMADMLDMDCEINPETLTESMKGALGVIDNIRKKIEIDEEQKQATIKKAISSYIVEKIKIFAVYAVICVVIAHELVYLFNIVRAFVFLNPSYIDFGVLYHLFWAIFPFGVWVYSTKYDCFNFHKRKFNLLMLCYLNVSLIIAAMIFIVFTYIAMAFVNISPISRDITADMLLDLVRFLCIYIIVLPVFFIMRGYYRVISHRFSKNVIFSFKFEKWIDIQKYSKYAYNMSIIRNLETGRKFVVREKERFQHYSFNGVTGTGKSSMCISVAYLGDLLQRIKNINVLKKAYSKLLDNKHIYMNSEMGDADFRVSNFTAIDKYGERKMAALAKKVQVCGITAMAPNTKFADELSEMCLIRGIRFNRVDPYLDPEDEHWVGFNPLFINPLSQGLERQIEITTKAVLFADVLQSLFEMSGKSDPFFMSLNRCLTTSCCIVICETSDIVNRRQATPADFEAVINDFTKIRPYIEALENREGGVGPYRGIVDMIKLDLLGEGAKKLMEHARGLRNMVEELLMNSLVRQVLCAEKSIDLDRALRDGEITIVNYPLELGKTIATSFGMFYALNFNAAVLRRTGKVLNPHFLYIDELPLILSAKLDSLWSLGRQYRNATGVAFQTLAQIEEVPNGKMFLNLLMGSCATQVIYGGIAPVEMRLYEELAGEEEIFIEQTSVSETSLTVDNPTYSYGTRLSEGSRKVMTGREMRMRDFKEVTVLSKRNGNVVDLFAGMTGFLSDYDRVVKGKQTSIDWSKYWDAELADGTEKIEPVIVEETPIKNTEVINEIDTLPVEAVVSVDDGADDDEPMFSLDDEYEDMEFDGVVVEASVDISDMDIGDI